MVGALSPEGGHDERLGESARTAHEFAQAGRQLVQDLETEGLAEGARSTSKMVAAVHVTTAVALLNQAGLSFDHARRELQRSAE